MFSEGETEHYQGIDQRLNFALNCSKLTIITIALTQPTFTCSKLTIETVTQGVKYVQS